MTGVMPRDRLGVPAVGRATTARGADGAPLAARGDRGGGPRCDGVACPADGHASVRVDRHDSRCGTHQQVAPHSLTPGPRTPLRLLIPRLDGDAARPGRIAVAGPAQGLLLRVLQDE